MQKAKVNISPLPLYGIKLPISLAGCLNHFLLKLCVREEDSIAHYDVVVSINNSVRPGGPQFEAGVGKQSKLALFVGVGYRIKAGLILDAAVPVICWQ